MIYLDYSATTPVNEEVLKSFNKTCLEYPGNTNSLHKLGVKSKTLQDGATEQIANLLNVDQSEIIYTSGSSESNNLAIKGIAYAYQNRGKHIITTPLEHSSIYGPLNYLQEQGFIVDFVNIDNNGMVDINHLKSLITDQTILVSIASVNSEIGLLQPIEEIGLLLKNYNCFFHVDMTQSIGKVSIPLDNVDLASFSAHKFYGLKGIGCLIKKKKINLTPLIHGGKSTTIYRSGTPALPLIVSLSKALRLAYVDFNLKYDYVKELNNYLQENLYNYEKIHINSNDYCIPHILNFSVIGIKPETLVHALEEWDVYISTQSACSSDNTISKQVLELTHDEVIATYSVRISLSYLTTKKEIQELLNIFDKCYHHLLMENSNENN